MDSRFLTLKSCIQGIFVNLVEPIFWRVKEPVSIPAEYRLVRWIKRQGGDNVASVGIFEDKQGTRVIIKHLSHRWKTLDYRYILNEVSILAAARDWHHVSQNGRQVRLPALREFRDIPGELIVVKEFVDGETLDTVSAAEQQAVTRDCLEALRALGSSMLHPMGKRTAWQLGLSFPFYWVRVLMKDPFRAPLLLRSFFLFYRQWPSTMRDSYAVTHRDLHAKNILVSGSSVVILDLESMVLCNEETDLALTARFNLKGWGASRVRDFLSSVAVTPESKRSFSALSIYYGVQIMVTDRINGVDYREALNYLTVFESYFATLT